MKNTKNFLLNIKIKKGKKALAKARQAFTLLELVVITIILLILGTIAIISLQSYSALKRDAKRISDINNIETSLVLFNTISGRYPEPDGIINVVYSGAVVWSQGVVGEKSIKELIKLSEIPLDPLLEIPYTYSLLNTKREYELGSFFEGYHLITNSDQLLKKTYAAKKSYSAYIKGNYNKKIAKVFIGGKSYILAVPSIISSDLSNKNITEIVKNKLLVFNGYQNIPSNYWGNNILMSGGFNFGGSGINPLIYNGELEILSKNYNVLKNFGLNLQAIYSGSILSNNDNYIQLVQMNVNNPEELFNVIGDLVK